MLSSGDFGRRKQNRPGLMFFLPFILIILLGIGFLVFSLTGGAEGIKAWFSSTTGELLGNSYTVSEFDDYGNKVFDVYGNRISIKGNTMSNGNLSSYIDITIDGNKWDHVGSTLVFRQEDVDMITDFQIPEDMQVGNSSSTGFMPADRIINNYKNFFGRESVIVVSSQMGTPIGLFQGNSVHISEPEDLPKMTMISIDGKLVYVHRANIDVLPASMFK